MAKILGLSFIYPPGDGVGGRRFFNYLKVLNKLNAEIHVLTCSREVYLQKNIPVNESTLKEGDKYTALRVPYKEIPGFLYKIYWIVYSVIMGVRTVRENKLDCIFATGDPWFVYISACIISLMTNNRLILDYRDPWYPSLNIQRKTLVKFIEYIVLSISHRAIFTTTDIENRYREIFPSYSSKYEVVENGIDAESIKEQSDFSFEWFNHNKLNIIFSGNIIPVRQGPLRKIYEAFVMLSERLRNKVQFIFYTNTGTIIEKISLKFIPQDHLHINQYVPKEHLYSAISESDICLMIDKSRIEVATKLIEYIALSKPVLAIVPKDSANADMILKYNAGWIVDTEDSNEDAADVFKNIIHRWQNNDLPVLDIDAAKEFSFEKNKYLIKEIFNL